MKKNILKLFLFVVCAFALTTNVNAAGKFTYTNTKYCYNENGTVGKTVNSASNSCSGYYWGTVVKKIDGKDAYCAQQSKGLAKSGSTCKAMGYNKKAWMNGHWTEANAIKVGYMIQYIKGKKYSHANEYTYIVNATNQMLQFQGAPGKRSLHSNIQKAINSASNSYDVLKANKKITGTPVSAAMNNAILVKVNNTYSKGTLSLKMNNTNKLAAMTVSAKCTNCTLYTDSALTKVYTGTTVKAGKSSNLTLYVKSNNNLAGGTKVSAAFTANFAKITYPIAKLWSCSDTTQSVVTLDSNTITLGSKSIAVSAVTPIPTPTPTPTPKPTPTPAPTPTPTPEPEKKYCVVEGNTYYGKDGSVVDEARYREECLKICKIEDGKYYGKNGIEVDEAKYKEDCLPICKIEDGKYYGKNGTEVDETTYRNDCLKICKTEDGKYFGKDGNEVSKDEYKEQCLPICRIENGKYFGQDGIEVTEDQYRTQCLPAVEVDVPSTGTNASGIPFVLGLSFITAGCGIFYKKKYNM